MVVMRVLCTRSVDGRYKQGKVYDVDNDGRIIDEYGDDGCLNDASSFDAWNKDCNWTDDYKFELVEE